MRKILLFSSVTFSVLCLSAADIATYQGSAFLKTEAQSNINSIAKASATEVFVAGTFANYKTGSTETVDVFWNDQQIVSKESYSSTVMRNVVLARVNSECKLVWSLVPDFCQAENSGVNVASLADGSVVYVLNLRAANADGKAFSFTDKSGRKEVVTVPVQEANSYTVCGLLLCLDGDGNYKWHKAIEADNYAPTSDGSQVKATAAFVATAIVAASDGGFYVAGNYDGKGIDFGNDVKAPASVNTVVVDSKVTGKSSFIVEFGADGVAKSVKTGLLSATPGTEETQQVLATDNDNLYLAEFVKPKASTSFSVPGLADSYEKNSIVYLSFGKTGDSTKAGVISATGNLTSQLAGADICDGELLISGNINNAIAQYDKTIATPATANKLENATIRASFTDGEPSVVYLSGLNIGQNQLAWSNRELNKLYTYGYVMNSKILLGIYNLATGELIENQSLATGISSTGTAIYDDGSLWGNAYCKSVTFAGQDTPAYTNTVFNGMIAHWQVTDNEPAAGVSTVGLDIDTTAPVEYYNLQGIRILNPAAGTFVIRRQGSDVSKVIM